MTSAGTDPASSSCRVLRQRAHVVADGGCPSAPFARLVATDEVDAAVVEAERRRGALEVVERLVELALEVVAGPRAPGRTGRPR